MSADVNYVGEVRPNPGNKADACCEICGALLVCLSCGNHRDENFARLTADLALWRRRAEWQEITPENLPKEGDEVICDKDGVLQQICDDSCVSDWTEWGYTHFRPINPPEPR